AGLPPMASGLFGFLGYDMVRDMERLPDNNPDPIGLPDAIMVRPTLICIFDRLEDNVTLVTPVWPQAGTGARAAYEAAQERLRDNIVTIRPLAGTIRRGATPEEDKHLADKLLADPKEHAEHLMLLDLARNDVGRVAKIGSVRVVEQFTIEKYSHLQHISSHVEGRLDDGLEAIDALKAGFPAGTLSGAPKVRAMEIIDEVEPVRRGIYAGCAGYFAANGSMDTCILLRTGLVKDNTMYVQAGVGVVADSDLEAEYQESIQKARALV